MIIINNGKCLTWHIANGGQSAKVLVFRILVLSVPSDNKVVAKPPQAICWAVMHKAFK
jgi:hypothetical protein